MFWRPCPTLVAEHGYAEHGYAEHGYAEHGRSGRASVTMRPRPARDNERVPVQAEGLDVLYRAVRRPQQESVDHLGRAVTADLWAFDQRSQSAEVPLVIPQFMVPLGLSIMAVLVIVRLVTGGDHDQSRNSSH